jgi:hypothetical protein
LIRAGLLVSVGTRSFDVEEQKELLREAWVDDEPEGVKPAGE